MKTEDIKRMAQAWNQVQEASYGKKKEAMDPVDAKELKGKHKDRKDKDIDNDGDVDSSDEYLHKRRKAVSKAIKGNKKGTEVETELDENKTAKMLHKHMLKALGKSNLPKNHQYTSAIANNGDFVVQDGGGRIAGRLKKGEHDVPAKMTEGSVELDEAVHSVFIDHEGDQDRDAFKHNITLKHHGRGAGATATGKKKDLRKYLTKHYVGREDAKDAHPEVFESVELDELSKKTLGSYIKKADKQADKAADSYSNAAVRRSDFAPDTPAMAKNAKKFAKRDAGADLARRKLAKESLELDELSKKTLGSYINKSHRNYDKQRTKQGAAYDKAARTGRDDDEDKGHEYGRKADQRTKGIKTAVNKLTKEAKDHGNMNNGSPRGEGLSPSAKKELARTTPMNPATDEPMVNKKTFDAIRASGKKAPMRSNDNAAGEKNIKPSATQVRESLNFSSDKQLLTRPHPTMAGKHELVHTDRSMLMKIKKGMSDHEKKHMSGAYRDDTDIVHNKTGKTMTSIHGKTVGQARKEIQNHIAKHHPDK